jgi:hypothetical protein
VVETDQAPASSPECNLSIQNIDVQEGMQVPSRHYQKVLANSKADYSAVDEDKEMETELTSSKILTDSTSQHSEAPFVTNILILEQDTSPAEYAPVILSDSSSQNAQAQDDIITTSFTVNTTSLAPSISSQINTFIDDLSKDIDALVDEAPSTAPRSDFRCTLQTSSTSVFQDLAGISFEAVQTNIDQDSSSVVSALDCSFVDEFMDLPAVSPSSPPQQPDNQAVALKLSPPPVHSVDDTECYSAADSQHPNSPATFDLPNHQDFPTRSPLQNQEVPCHPNSSPELNENDAPAFVELPPSSSPPPSSPGLGYFSSSPPRPSSPPSSSQYDTGEASSAKFTPYSVSMIGFGLQEEDIDSSPTDYGKRKSDVCSFICLIFFCMCSDRTVL